MSGLTLESLVEVLNDSNEVKSVKRKLKELKKASSSVPKPLEKVVTDRVERKLTYESNKEDMGKWQETIVSNRNKKSLDLVQDRQLSKPYKALINEFSPQTELEKDVEMVLVGTKSKENQVEQEELRLLTKAENIEDIKAKHSELAKLKSLMFYDQMRRHRMNKIKSKTYRKILKRKKSRAGGSRIDQSDINAESEGGVDELLEEQVTKRIKERMDLKHGNTGRWARMASKHSRADKSLRYLRVTRAAHTIKFFVVLLVYCRRAQNLIRSLSVLN